MIRLLFNPSKLWFISTRWHARGWHRRARLIKAYIFVVFRAVLPPEAQLEGPVSLGHLGLGVVVHPNVSIGLGVMIWHRVTLSVGDSPGTQTRLTVGSDVMFGAGSAVVGRERKSLAIVAGTRIGANAVVTSDIVEPGSYGGIPVRRLSAK